MSTSVIASAAKQSIWPRQERMDCFVAALLAMTARGLRIRLDQSTFGNQRPNLVFRKSRLPQNLPAMLTESWRMLPDRRRGLAPARGGARNPQRAFGRVLDRMKQTDRGEMRIVDQAVEVVQRRMRNVGLVEERHP